MLAVPELEVSSILLIVMVSALSVSLFPVSSVAAAKPNFMGDSSSVRTINCFFDAVSTAAASSNPEAIAKVSCAYLLSSSTRSPL